MVGSLPGRPTRHGEFARLETRAIITDFRESVIVSSGGVSQESLEKLLNTLTLVGKKSLMDETSSKRLIAVLEESMSKLEQQELDDILATNITSEIANIR